MPDPRAQGLLVAFLKNLYNPVFVDVCVDRYKFVPITGDLQELALQGIDMLKLSPEAPEWEIETDEVLGSGVGMSDYVISTRRSKTTQLEQEILIQGLNAEAARVDLIVEDLESMRDEIARLMNFTLDGVRFMDEQNGARSLDDSDQKKLDMSFILSILSICLWFVTICAFFVHQKRLSKPLAAEKTKQHHHQHHSKNKPDSDDPEQAK
jgi:hypothetical protein